MVCGDRVSQVQQHVRISYGLGRLQRHGLNQEKILSNKDNNNNTDDDNDMAV